MKYAPTVMAHAPAMLSQNEKPLFNNNGSTKNSGSEANTNQKMLCERDAIACVFPVSRYSHTNANRDVSGSDAMMAPQKELRFATSATATTARAVIRTFIATCHISLRYAQRPRSGDALPPNRMCQGESDLAGGRAVAWISWLGVSAERSLLVNASAFIARSPL